jgi:arsenical pump membrane protein
VIPAGSGALRCGIIGTDDPGMPRRAQRGDRREDPGSADQAAGALNGVAAEALAAALLVVVILSAASRRWWLPEPVAAAAAAILMLTGVLSVAEARATLAGFVLTSFAGVNPAWAALAGACLLGARELARRQVTALDLIRAASLPFLLFVLGLGLVVQGVTVHGLGTVGGYLIPGGSSLLVLLAIAAVSAVLANAVNNLPAVLILLSVLAARGVPPAPDRCSRC